MSGLGAGQEAEYGTPKIVAVAFETPLLCPSLVQGHSGPKQHLRKKTRGKAEECP